MSDNIKQKTLNSIRWIAIERLAQQSIQFIIGIVLANLLQPKDYGLVGLLAVFHALSFVLVDSGFGQALVRKQTNNEKEFSTIFFFNIAIALFIYLLLFLSAPLIATFFKTPQLVSLARVGFVVIPINALYLIPFIKLGIILDYRSITKVNLLATLTSGIIGIFLAVNGNGVWALVWQMVAYHFFRWVFFYLIIHWKPTLDFSFQYIKEHWRYSINLLGTGVLNVLFNHIFLIVFGRLLPLQETGYYNQAYKQAETANYTFVSILTGSSYNIFSQINQDKIRLRRALKQFVHKSAVVVIPAIAFLIASADNLITTLIGEKWQPAIPYFRLICITHIVTTLYTLNINVINAIGLSKNTFKIEIIKKTLIILSILLSFPFGGKIMIIGYAIVCWFAYGVTMISVKKELNYYGREQLKDIAPAILIGIVLGTVVFALSQLSLSHPLRLTIEILIAIPIYGLLIKYLYNDFYLKIIEKTQDFISKIKRR